MRHLYTEKMGVFGHLMWMFGCAAMGCSEGQEHLNPVADFDEPSLKMSVHGTDEAKTQTETYNSAARKNDTFDEKESVTHAGPTSADHRPTSVGNSGNLAAKVDLYVKGKLEEDVWGPTPSKLGYWSGRKRGGAIASLGSKAFPIILEKIREIRKVGVKNDPAAREQRDALLGALKCVVQGDSRFEPGQTKEAIDFLIDLVGQEDHVDERNEDTGMSASAAEVLGSQKKTTDAETKVLFDALSSSTRSWLTRVAAAESLATLPLTDEIRKKAFSLSLEIIWNPDNSDIRESCVLLLKRFDLSDNKDRTRTELMKYKSTAPAAQLRDVQDAIDVAIQSLDN